jgi:hypothetical protein
MVPAQHPLPTAGATITLLDLAYRVQSDPAVDMCTMIPRGLGTFTFDFAFDEDPDVYVCVNGNFCGSDACYFAFASLIVRADVPSLIVDSCIETMEEFTSFQTVVPGPSPSFDYSVRFSASWAIRYNSDASIASCTSANPALIVLCENDARIDIVTATETSMNCTEIGSSELRCPSIYAAMINNYVTYIRTLKSMFSC